MLAPVGRSGSKVVSDVVDEVAPVPSEGEPMAPRARRAEATATTWGEPCV